MKIRHKLFLSFSTVGSIILLIFGITIYLFSSNHKKQEFYNQLSHRVNITEKMFLEKDHFSEKDFEKIRQEFLHTLPEEEEEVIKIGDAGIESVQYDYPKDFIRNIITNSHAWFEEGDRQGAGKYFHLDGKDYIVIVTAIDNSGIKKLIYLRGIIITGLIVCIFLFSLLSVPLSARIIKPLSYKIRMANMISANNLHQRLTGISSKDEIGELAIAFNHLLDRIENAFETRKRFISNASHEIRNPLTAIINEADISLEKKRTGDEYRESLNSISTEAERMQLLVDNLLELSKISDADTSFQFDYLPLIPLVEEVVKKYGFTGKENQIKVIIKEQPSGFDPGIWGNKNLIMSALTNIIDNACKFSNGKEVLITLSSEAQNAVITVQDEGIGIPEEDLNHITEAFYRASNARTIKGSGIGITLARRIVEIHKGELLISSKIGEGTEVKIYLPFEEPIKT